MKILVLGGTHFVGRAVVEAALLRGHEVTVVSRGQTGTVPAGATSYRADRREPDSLQSLTSSRWNAVIDTWAEEPSVVATAAATLADCADWYGYISTRSVYQWPPAIGSDESAPVVDPAVDEGYGANKREAELAVLDHFSGRSLIARAGCIVGPYEDTGRLTWWLERAAMGGCYVAPEPAEQIWQLIDARDLADFMLSAAASRTAGVFNVVSPRSDGTTTRRLVDACLEVTGQVATAVWVSPKLLARAGVPDWDGLPGWVPPDSDAMAMHHGDVSAAVAAGLTCRPIEATVSDTWHWLQSAPPATRRSRKPGTPRRGLTAEQEQAIWWLSPSRS